MRVVEAAFTPIAIADPPLRSSYGLHAPYALRTIVELRSEDGIVGIAETRGGDAVLADFERARPLIEGSDAYDLSRLRTAVAETVGNNPVYAMPGEQPHPRSASSRIYGALEIAALDLIGKSVGVPVADLLGGRARDEVTFAGYLFYKHAGGGGEDRDARDDVFGEALSPEAIVAQAHAMRKAYGFTSFKLKAGVLEPDLEIETLLALRAAMGPRVQLRMDPNCVWSMTTALRVTRCLHGTLEYLEDPVTGIEGLGELHRAMERENCVIPLASNVAVTHFEHLPHAIELGAVQVVLGDHHFWGGARAIVELGCICETFGLGVSMHSNTHLGVSLMAMVHIAAATPQLTHACDTHYPWQDGGDEVVEGGRIVIRDGCIPVPATPGLGVTLDRDRLARGRERYERMPYRNRDDTAEMRKHVDPGWTRRIPAW